MSLFPELNLTVGNWLAELSMTEIPGAIAALAISTSPNWEPCKEVTTYSSPDSTMADIFILGVFYPCRFFSIVR